MIKKRLHYLFILVPLLFYFATTSRYIGSPDTTILMDAMMKPVINTFACNHNLTNLLGFLIHYLPFQPLAFRFHLVSTICGSAAIILFYIILLRLGASRTIASICSGIFMVSHSMWWHSTIVENYALNIVFILTCLLLVLLDQEKRKLGLKPIFYITALFFLAGLSLFNHIQNILLTVSSFVYLFLLVPKYNSKITKTVLLSLIAYLVGLSPYIFTVIFEVLHGAHPAEILYQATGGGFKQLMFQYDFPSSFSNLARWILLQFPSPFLFFIPLGIGISIFDKNHRLFFTFIYIILLVNTVFFMGYVTWDQFAFYLPSFTMLALLGSYSAIRISRKITKRTHKQLLVASLILSLLLPVFIYPRISLWSKEEGYFGRRYGYIERAYCMRYDMVDYIVNPNKRNQNSIEEFIRLVLKKLPLNAILIDDCSSYYQIIFLQKHEGLRPDIDLKLIRPLGINNWGKSQNQIVSELKETQRNVFLIASTGPCGELINKLKQEDGHIEKFSLCPDKYIFKLVTQKQIEPD